MNIRCFQDVFRKRSAAYALCLLLFAALSGCDNPSTTPDLAVLYPPPNPGPSLTPGDAEIQVQFTKVETALSYRVYYSKNPSPGGDYVTVRQPSNQLVEAFIGGLDNGVTYYVWAEARYADARSSLAGPVWATPRRKPDAPAYLTIKPYGGVLELSWPLVSDPACSADSYEIYWSETDVDVPPEDAESQENIYIDRDYAVMGLVSGLTDGKPYTVWVRAKNSTGLSEKYVKERGTPSPSPGTPAVPGAPELTKSDGQLTVSWDAVSGATGYKLYYGTASDFSQAQAKNENPSARRVTCFLTGLTNRTPYYVWVAAVNGVNESEPSDPNSETPQPKPALNINDISQIVGYTTARFPNEAAGKGDRLSRKEETAIGDLVADSMFYWADKHKGDTRYFATAMTKIDFAFVNGGVIVSGLPKGPISNGIITKALHPEGDRMTILTMTGADIKTLFRQYVAKVRHDGGGGKGTGAFGQVSYQITYTIDYHDDSRGGTITDPDPRLKGDPFVDDQRYTFVTNEYIVRVNDDGYVPILNPDYNTNVTRTKTVFDGGKERLISESVAEYIYDKNGVPIEPKTDGRITLLNELW